MRKYIFLFLSFNLFHLNAQEIELSSSAEVSILTLGPDENLLYSAFWHSAIRIKDPVNRIDWIYDYGRFDFDNPNFYTDFAKGYLSYSMGLDEYRKFKSIYIYYNRTIEEQLINLSQTQKQRIFEFLQNNYKPENRSYFYDYYYNNCATKIRDVFKEVLGDSLQFDPDYVETGLSFRQLTDSCTRYQPWGDYGIDLALGLPIDKKASSWEYMFLPKYIFQAFSKATILTANGVEPAVLEYKLVHQGAQDAPNTFITPHVVFWIFFLMVVLITLWNWKSGKPGKWFDIIFFSILGLVGLILSLIWLATDHHAAANNFNIVWAFPLHLVVIFLLLKSKNNYLRIYFIATLIVSVLLLLFWKIIPQQLHSANIPIVLAIILRSYHIIKTRKLNPYATR